MVGDGLIAHLVELILHAANAPKQVDRRGTRGANHIADLLELAPQLIMVGGLRFADTQRNAHCCRHSDGGRAANDHGADGVGHFFVGRAGDVGFFRGQLRLIDEAHARVGPFQSLDHDLVISES